jgi:hypothetical protein
MQAITKTILTLFLVAGCAQQPPSATTSTTGSVSESECSGNGPNPTWIKYGDSKISAKTVTNIKVDKYWRIKLQPDSGYENSIVTITGKNPTHKWLVATGSKASAKETNGELLICVPGKEVTVGDQLYFTISVAFVGLLDPRADVVD